MRSAEGLFLLNHVVAFPESRRILRLHIASSLLTHTYWGVVGILPVLLRKGFDASVLETTIASAAIGVMALFSIFWKELYLRMRPGPYLLLTWCLMYLPLAGIAACHRAGTVLLFYLLSALAFGAPTAFAGDLLRSCYPPGARSRVFGLVTAAQQVAVIVSAWFVGHWLDRDPQSFRVYLPTAVVLMGLGVWLQARIAAQPLFVERLVRPPAEPLRVGLVKARHYMFRVLRDDPDFRRYEIAFFYYGLGFMFGAALMPFLVCDRLRLDYAQVTRATQVVYQSVLLICTVPAGYLMERHGPVRVAGWSFAMLALCPLGLIFARDEATLTAVMIGNGVAMAGVNLAWTVGPVVLPRDPSQAGAYVAIHATLVGFRGLLGHFPAVMLYVWTGSIEVPLVLAMLLTTAGAVVMLRLARRRVAPGAPPAVPPVGPGPGAGPDLSAGGVERGQG